MDPVKFLFHLCFSSLLFLSSNQGILDLVSPPPVSFCTMFMGIDQGVSSKDQDVICKEHNRLRKLIADGKVSGQPKGKDFKHMKWDKKLAIEAQRLANKCIYEHSPVEDSRWEEVGQNIHRKRSNTKHNGTHWKSAMQHWFDENKHYKYGNKSIDGTGHYTQLIWHLTEYVGCGYTFYITKESLKYQKLYFCNYGPGGNIEGAVPYPIDD